MSHEGRRSHGAAGFAGVGGADEGRVAYELQTAGCSRPSASPPAPERAANGRLGAVHAVPPGHQTSSELATAPRELKSWRSGPVRAGLAGGAGLSVRLDAARAPSGRSGPLK